MNNKLFTCVLLLSLALSPVYASTEKPERGWWWGLFESLWDDEDEDEEPEEERVIVLPVEPREEEKDCTDPEQWDTDCGFVDPDGSFEFQSIQQQALLENATMNPNDPEAVEAFQRYMRWAINQSITMARMWQWNMLQNQELNPRIHSPVSAFGIRAALNVREGQEASVMKEIKTQGGFLVWFTRTSCPYCHSMLPSMKRLERLSGLTVWNVALDDECMDGFEGKCRGGERAIEAARHLGIAAVPDLWLHLPQDDVWLRISSGVEAIETITARVELFFGAVQRAAAKGIQNSGGIQPSVDFSVPEFLERSAGGMVQSIAPYMENE